MTTETCVPFAKETTMSNQDEINRVESDIENLLSVLDGLDKSDVLASEAVQGELEAAFGELERLDPGWLECVAPSEGPHV